MQIGFKPKLRSGKWICSSSEERNWNSDSVKYAGAEYFHNNLLNPVNFKEATRHIPANAVVIEIAPQGFLLKMLTDLLANKTLIHTPLMAKNETNNLKFFLRALGK